MDYNVWAVTFLLVFQAGCKEMFKRKRCPVQQQESADSQQKQGTTFSGQAISPWEFHTALQSSKVLTTVKHAAATGII